MLSNDIRGELLSLMSLHTHPSTDGLDLLDRCLGDSSWHILFVVLHHHHWIIIIIIIIPVINTYSYSCHGTDHSDLRDISSSSSQDASSISESIARFLSIISINTTSAFVDW